MITSSFRPTGARPGLANAATRTWSGQVEIFDSASVAGCARVYYASKQTPRGEIASRRGARPPSDWRVKDS